jgi:hypothetical protein
MTVASLNSGHRHRLPGCFNIHVVGSARRLEIAQRQFQGRQRLPLLKLQRSYCCTRFHRAVLVALLLLSHLNRLGVIRQHRITQQITL